MEILNQNQETFKDIETIIRNAYGGNPEYQDTIFILGYNEMRTLAGIRHKNPGKNIVIIQLEQLFKGSPWWNRNAFGILDKADQILDYDESNIEFLAKYGVHADHWKIPLSDCLKWNLPKVDKIYDVLFYGSINERRAAIIYKIHHSYPDIKIKVLTDVWGDELKDYINCSKIQLNIHYYEIGIQEQVRLIPLLVNNCCVLSEKSKTNHFGDRIIECEYVDIPEKVKYLLEENRWEKW